MPGYRLFHKDYGYVFNSYYETVGKRVLRTNRGNLTRPSVDEVMKYRAYVDEKMLEYFDQIQECSEDMAAVIELGLQHEQQHQELLLYDIKYILGHNPLFPAYKSNSQVDGITSKPGKLNFLEIEGGKFPIGYRGDEFCFDNELGAHEVFLHDFAVSDRLVSNGEYLEFIEAGGYTQFQHWFSEAWDWVNQHEINAPLYWHKIEGRWHQYTFAGLVQIDHDEPVSHVSLFEADAFARWKNMRLATEFEWEAATQVHTNQIPDEANFVDRFALKPFYSDDNKQFFGDLWEWTNSAYLPYPYFKTVPGAIGEYNGKFMINQMVLRGGSYATPCNHIRPTYRNFFHPHLQWHFAGIRLARHI